MSGHERKRFCSECGKHVYNLSAMTAKARKVQFCRAAPSAHGGPDRCRLARVKPTGPGLPPPNGARHRRHGPRITASQGPVTRRRSRDYRPWKPLGEALRERLRRAGLRESRGEQKPFGFPLTF